MFPWCRRVETSLLPTQTFLVLPQAFIFHEGTSVEAPKRPCGRIAIEQHTTVLMVYCAVSSSFIVILKELFYGYSKTKPNF